MSLRLSTAALKLKPIFAKAKGYPDSVINHEATSWLVRSCACFFLFLSFGSTSIAHAWAIESFHLEANIQADGSVQIREEITADFSDNLSKHGIIREIPFRYEDEAGKIFKTPLTGIQVTNKTGAPRPVKQSQSGANQAFRIGDPNRTVTTQEVYVIDYTLSGVINEFETHDEFYWNVTGNDWDAPIKKATAVVLLPQSGTQLKAECYTGRAGSKNQDCSYQMGENQRAAAFKTDGPLAPGEGLTLVFGWDKGLVQVPARKYEADWSWLQYLAWLFWGLPIYAGRRWWQVYSQTKVNKPVIPLYEPPKEVTLSEAGFLYDKIFASKDLSAIIINLCVKGYMTIEAVDKQKLFFKSRDFKFSKTENQNETRLNAVEKMVMEGIFYLSDQNTLSGLQRDWHSILSKTSFNNLKTMVTAQVVEKNYYQKTTSSKKLVPALSVFGSFGVFFLGLTLNLNFMDALFPLIGGAVILSLFPKTTLKGNQVKHQLKGLAQFIKTADKDRINWSEAQGIFEKNLPYAITFGLTNFWVKKFEGHITMPAWYQSDRGFAGLQKDLGLIGTQISQSSALKSQASSGGSGFGGGSSGGGFGGGGGSSW